MNIQRSELSSKEIQMAQKKLLEGVWADETIEYLHDKEWICTEKIDGTNIGVHWDGHKIQFQGRTERASIPAHLTNALVSLFGGDATEELFEQTFHDKEVILFGEGYGPKIQKGGGDYRADVSFILFDVFFPEPQTFLPREGVESVAKTFGIDCVPVILRGTLDEAVEYVKQKPRSTFGTAAMEGLVCTPTVNLRDRRGRTIKTKVKVKDLVC